MALRVWETKVGRGEVAVSLLNEYSGVVIRTSSLHMLINPTFIDAEKIPRVDYIFITSEHERHLDIDLIEEIVSRDDCYVFSDPTSAEYLRRIVPAEMLRICEPRDNIEFSDILVEVYGGREGSARTPVTYFITTDNDRKIYHVGNSEYTVEMSCLRERPELLFCPVAPYIYGVEIARNVEADVIIPYNWLRKRNEIEKFCKILEKIGLDDKVKILDVGEVYVW